MEQQTARVWEADLSDPSRKLTVEELTALEVLHHCQSLGRLVVAMENAVLHLQSLEGRFDRLEQFLMQADPRYPASPHPTPALPPGERR